MTEESWWDRIPDWQLKKHEDYQQRTDLSEGMARKRRLGFPWGVKVRGGLVYPYIVLAGDGWYVVYAYAPDMAMRKVSSALRADHAEYGDVDDGLLEEALGTMKAVKFG